MDYSRPDRAERLAADYVVGTMHGGARRRMKALLPAHPHLRRAVVRWEERLAGMDALRPGPHEEPSAQVWPRIEARLFGDAGAAGTRTTAHTAPHAAPVDARGDAPRRGGVGSWWQSLALWRTASALATAAALGLLLTIGQAPRDSAPPIIVVLQANPDAVQGAQALQARFVASLSADGRSLVLEPLGRLDVDVGRALELWAVPKQGAPRSLGLVKADAKTTLLQLRVVQGADALAISVEPEGGSPTGAPTGPIVSLGKFGI